MKKIPIVVLPCLILAACMSPDPRRQEYIAAHPELTVMEKDCISQGVICRGLTQEDVRLIWGDPTAVNQVKSGKGEQWVYEGSGQFSRSSDYVNFDQNGRVTDWQRIQ